LGLDPQMFLKGGDEMELGIEGLGVARQKVRT
jgi:2-keto-4-pentenoate hydratase/2-oxohepta-3-ene-1,7-dioic acid hydratase in catechol pathway